MIGLDFPVEWVLMNVMEKGVSFQFKSLSLSHEFRKRFH